jgi:penicillin-binding protein 1A
MRAVLKIFLIFIGMGLLIPIAAFGWLYFDSTGLPDWRELAQFAPATPKQVSDPCLRTNEPILAYPYDAIGANLRAALSAVEASEDDPGILDIYYPALIHRAHPRASLSYLIERDMFCQPYPGRTVNHHLDSLRLAIQLERHFSRRELFTIFANRLYFAEGQYGVANAARHFFNKESSQLDIEEAALLAGMPREPGRYSPRFHPDQALQRRNRVIDSMAAAHAIGEADATSAKAVPITVMPIEHEKIGH